ncbi:hypothetical protein [Ureaplasma diversum]|uniref:Lipoprotein n=1 Tax=Ureaplasma diversum NCTC 246 TaxID=1188241 RepID=A0A084F1M9_9BACT|nr:hypothetical protein [Ureaplasma diversum]KEZ24121.1 Hypothetical protein, predicted lipoprotein [Ureaplasma diversum NCTC 246]
MKLNKNKKRLFALLATSALVIVPLIAASCSAAANPVVKAHYVTIKDNGKLALTIKAPNGANAVHELAFQNQNLLNQQYFRSGDLSYVTVKDNKRVDKNNKEIDANGYVLVNEKPEVVWTKDTDPKKINPISIAVLQNEMLRTIHNGLSYHPLSTDKDTKTSTLPINFETLNTQTNQYELNKTIYNEQKLASIKNAVDVYNKAQVSDSVYAYATTMTDELTKFLAQEVNVKDYNFRSQQDSEVKQEFLNGLVRGVGAGRRTFKLALYNFEFEYEFIKGVKDLSIDLPQFGQPLTDQQIADRSLHNVFVRVKNIKLHYAWLNTSAKDGASFMLPEKNSADPLKNPLSLVNAALSVDDKKVYKDGVKNLVYALPINDMVFNFAPATLRVDRTNQELTSKNEALIKANNNNKELTQQQKDGAVVHYEYFTGGINKIQAFNVLGKELKADTKALFELENRKYTEDKDILDHLYYEHNNGINGVYPYAFIVDNQPIVRDHFISSRKFVEAIKKSVVSKKVDEKQQYANLAFAALANPKATIGTDANNTAAAANLTKYVVDLNKVVASNQNVSDSWNEKTS